MTCIEALAANRPLTSHHPSLASQRVTALTYATVEDQVKDWNSFCRSHAMCNADW